MKSYKVIILLIVFIKFSNIYALSENFQFVIDTIGIPKYNSRFQVINEEIYYAYNIFAYAGPLNHLNNPMQRFKKVEQYGKWTLNGGKYSGYGERGEYYLIGEAYSGSPISNVYFPVDALPESTPDSWNFIYDNEAYLSWQDRSKYKYYEQLEYMKRTELLFDYIDLKNGICNSYNLVPYNISVYKIGLNKMKLDTCSTWKTNGIVTAKRLTPNNLIRYAIFATAPIEAKAEILAKVLVNNDFVLNSSSNELDIQIKFGAKVINMSDMANAKHVKEIVSILYIDGNEIDRISANRITEIFKIINYKVSRDKYNLSKKYPINIEVKTYLYTEFNVDGLMQNNLNKEISLQVEEENINKIKEVSIANVKKVNTNYVLAPLIETINSKKRNSLGIIEKQRYAAIKITKNRSLDNIKLKLNDKEVNYELLYDKNSFMVLKFIIDKSLNNTISSWSYIRNEIGNYFEIDTKLIGERIENPIKLEIIVNSKIEYTIYFDTIDEFNKNINFCFSNNVLNPQEVLEFVTLEDWVEL